MDGREFQLIVDRIDEIKKRLRTVQILAGITLGFLIGVAIFRAL